MVDSMAPPPASAAGQAPMGADPAARRARLTICANPEPRQDFVVTRTGDVTGAVADLTAHIRLRYVPDRGLITRDGWRDYLRGLSEQPFDTVEALTAAILADVANQLVPRWLDVRVHANEPLGSGAGSAAHEVIMEDRQPTWRNPALAARLGTG